MYKSPETAVSLTKSPHLPTVEPTKVRHKSNYCSCLRAIPKKWSPRKRSVYPLPTNNAIILPLLAKFVIPIRVESLRDGVEKEVATHGFQLQSADDPSPREELKPMPLQDETNFRKKYVASLPGMNNRRRSRCEVIICASPRRPVGVGKWLLVWVPGGIRTGVPFYGCLSKRR